MSLSNLFSKNTQCFFCFEEIKKKEAYTANIDTMEGRLAIKMCEKCASDFDDLLKNIEAVKNEGL